MRKINILLFFVFLSISSFAQTSLLFTTTLFTKNIDSATLGGVDSILIINDSLYNPNQNPVPTDSLTFGARVNSQLCSPSQFHSSGFAPGDSLFQNQPQPVSFIFHDSLPGHGGFVIGTNAVVIWPIINGGRLFPPRADSILINVNYTEFPLGIDEAPLAKMFILQYPGSLSLKFGDAENLVQQVRIFDVLGQGLFSGSAESSKSIPTGGWMKGVYLCEITTYSGEKRTIKFRLE